MDKKTKKNRLVRFVFFAILLIITLFEGICQEYPLREYSVRDGLPQSQANSVFQDSRGFIWIITRNGLSRFDGIDFINYYRQNGLPSNMVFQVSEDSNGDIWVLTSEGISKYSGTGFLFFPPGKNGERDKFFSNMTPMGIPGNYLMIARDRKDSGNRLYLFDNGSYKDFASIYPALDTIYFSNILYDTANSDLVISDKNGDYYSWKKERLTKLHIDKSLNLKYDRGKIFFWSYDTLLNYANGRIFPGRFGNQPGRAEASIVNTSAGKRAVYFDGSNTVTVKLPVYNAGPYVDNQGTLWLPSDRNLFRLPSTSFTTISDDLLKQSNLWAICMDMKGDLWIGSLEGNLFQFDGNKFRERTDFKKLFKEDVAFFKGSRLLSNGELWISLNCGVLIWDGIKFRKLIGLPENTQVCTIYEDPDDHSVLLGTQKGVFRAFGDSLVCYTRFDENNLGVIEGIVKDDSGFYWMSGHRSLVKFDGTKTEKVNDPVLPGAFTFTIEKDCKGGIWVSSDEGLFCKKKGEKYFRPGVPAEFNRPANVVKVLDDSHLMAGRGGDICIIDLDRFYNDEKDYYRIFDKTDGFPGGDCLDNGIVGYKEGSFLILTSDGLVRYDPEKVRKRMDPPITGFTGLFFLTDSLSWEAVRANEFYFRSPEDITLKRDQNKVKITFTGISTMNPEKVRYIHKLEGFEKKWSLPSMEREVIYDNLQHGQYRFLLKAINADRVETAEPVELKFRILPSFTETRIFSILAVLIVVISTAFLTKVIIKRNQRIREEKQKVTNELIKMQISAVLKELDPHFTFNAISSIGYLIMQGERKEAYTYLTRLSSLLRTILYDGTTIGRALSDELDFVRNYCELQKLRFEGRFTYNITLAENAEIYREVPKMSIQIFVENSLKHGFNGEMKGGVIDIIVSQIDNLMEIIVRDNGIGRAASQKLNTMGTGHGIKTVKRIFEIMNNYNTEKASVEIIDLMDGGKASGTEVKLRIPADYNFIAGRHPSV